MSDFTHIDNKGQARMVDVGGKPVTKRWAKASVQLRVSEDLFKKLEKHELKKGDAVGVARIAGIQAAKRTSDLIPLCHPIPINYVEVNVSLQEPHTIQIATEVRTSAVTGVEMEALTAAATAALTIYDMGKAVDRGIIITDLKLIEKGGGKSGLWKREKQ